MDIIYKKAVLEDLEQISNLMAKLHTDMTKEELFDENKFFINNDVFFVACDNSRADKKIVAYVFGQIRRDYVEGSLQYRDPKVGYIESLYVLPKYRKAGVARQLCRLLEEWSAEQGATEFASDAYLSNKRSIAFHKAIGMEVSKPIVHFIKKI